MSTVYLLAKTAISLTPDQRLKLEANLTEKFKKKWTPIGNGNYLVAADDNPTTSSVSELTGISTGETGAYIVTQAIPYFGWADNTIWEWISSHSNQ